MIQFDCPVSDESNESTGWSIEKHNANKECPSFILYTSQNFFRNILIFIQYVARKRSLKNIKKIT